MVASLRDVTQRYGDTVAVDSVNLDIPAGKMIGLIGPDGVGKSTLLAIIAGVRLVQQGRAEVLGGDIADKRFRESVCARVAYMPQGLGKNLYPTLSIFGTWISSAGCLANRVWNARSGSRNFWPAPVCRHFAIVRLGSFPAE